VYHASFYGAWGYPAYPPYYWAPPPYYYPGAAFVGGVLWGAAVVGIANGLWGGCNWGGGDVNINVNKHNSISNKQISGTNNKFSHNAERRGDVPYRDNKSRDQYGKGQREGAQSREAYRGKDGRDADRARAESTLKSRGADPAAGREALQGADRDRANAAVRDSSRAGGGGDRAGVGGSSGGASNRAGNQTGSSSALSGVRDSGGASRANADRGQASHSSMSSNRGGGGGGARAGGGGGGGGRRR